MKEKQVYKKIWSFPVKNFKTILFMASSSIYYVRKCGSTRLCDQNCGVQPADRQTQTDTGTDKSLKTEGSKILSNDIFYLRTVIIGGPIFRCGHVLLSFVKNR